MVLSNFGFRRKWVRINGIGVILRIQNKILMFIGSSGSEVESWERSFNWIKSDNFNIHQIF